MKRDLAKDMEMARDDFAEHRIAKSSLGRWLVRKPGTSTFWYEVVVLEGGYLLVHGDIQPVIFGVYHPSEKGSPEAAAIGCVNWMASRKSPDDSYFVEKATIGTRSKDVIWVPDEDVLASEIQALILEEGSDDVSLERREALQEALDNVGVLSAEEVRSQVYEALGDAERVPEGVRISPAMIYAHAALQKLAALLRESFS